MTYDPEADAITMRMGRGAFDRTEVAGRGRRGQDLGIEILFVSKVLAR